MEGGFVRVHRRSCIVCSQTRFYGVAFPSQGVLFYAAFAPGDDPNAYASFALTSVREILRLGLHQSQDFYPNHSTLPHLHHLPSLQTQTKSGNDKPGLVISKIKLSRFCK